MKQALQLLLCGAAIFTLSSCMSKKEEETAYKDSQRQTYVAGQGGIKKISGLNTDVFAFDSPVNPLDSPAVLFDPLLIVKLNGKSVGGDSNRANATTQTQPLYAASPTANAVYVIDSSTGHLNTTIPVGNAPVRIAISRDNTSLYVSNSQSDSISVISFATNTVTATIPLLAGSRPTGLAFTPDGSQLFVINSALNSISLIDPVAGKIVSTFASGQGPAALANTPDGNLLYVANSKDNTVTVYDTLTTEKVRTITGIVSPVAICFSVEGAAAYIVSATAPNGTLVILRTKDYATQTRLAVGANPVAVTQDTFGTLIYVVNQGSNSVTVINQSDYSLVGALSVPWPPSAVLSTP